MELFTKFPASNYEQYNFIDKKSILQNRFICLIKHLPQAILSISVAYFLFWNWIYKIL